MRVGTKSILFGVHAFWLHPWLVAIAWTKLYGFPWEPRLWVAFFVHDLGYISKPNMDGPEGEEHVYLGARIMEALFSAYWYDFCVRHSRFWCARHYAPPSRLCYADKLSIALMPWWLYVPLARLTSEIREYKTRVRLIEDMGGIVHFGTTWASDRLWFKDLQTRMRQYVATRT